MVAAVSRPPSSEHEDQRVLLLLPFDAYVALDDALGTHRGVHLTYLEGALEIMTKSRRHELVTITLGRLLDVWSEALDIDLRRLGGPTLRNPEAERGLEPDESFMLGARPIDRNGDYDRPDIALEVVLSSRLVDKLAVYAGLGIPEVWEWRDGTIQVHILEGDSYREASRSSLLPAIDLTLLAELAAEDDQLVAVKRLRAALRTY
jgi:Uma2 family endonuclease